MIQNKIKIRGCWYINRNWTIQKQILAISFIISSLIFIILLVIIWVSQSEIQENLKVVSQEIFMGQTSQQINNIWIYQRSLEQMIFQTRQQIKTTRAIYKYFDYLIYNPNRSVKFEYPHMCLNNISALDSYCYSSSTTYIIILYIFGEQENEETQSIIATTFILTSFRIALDHTFSAPLYYFLDNEVLFFCITAGGRFPSSFKPNERPYYLEFQKYTSQDTSVENVYFASPYKIIAGYIRIPMITALINQYDQIVGMVAKDIDFGCASITQSKNINTVLYVIDNEGKIYYSIIYNQRNLSVYYFNETKVTGFNQTDFEYNVFNNTLLQLMNQHKNMPFQNNCPLIQSDRILCRFNQKTKQNQIIKSSQIKGSNLILVVLVETNKIIQQIDDNLFLINQSQIQVSQQIILYLVVYPIGIIILSNILIYMLFRQFNQLLNLIKQKVYSNRKDLFLSEFDKEKSFFNSSSVTGLIQASVRKFNNLESFENINYPRYTHTQKKYQQNFVLTMQFYNQKFKDDQKTRNTIFDSIHNFIGRQKL